jgi:molybdopterin converting factor subunit 1
LLFDSLPLVDGTLLMKNVTVLYFAAVRDLAGTSTEELMLPDNVQTVQQFITYLRGSRGELSGALASVRVARNETFANADDPIEAGDTLALIPPVQGG